MSSCESIPDIDKAVAFTSNQALSNTDSTTNEQTVNQIDIISREIRSEIFDSFEAIYHPDCPSKTNLKHAYQITETFDEIKENILENIVSFKSKLAKRASKSCDKLHLLTAMSQRGCGGAWFSKAFSDFHQSIYSDNDLSSSVLSISSENGHSKSNSDNLDSGDYNHSYGVRIARSIEWCPPFFHVPASSSQYIFGKSESSLDLSSVSNSYQSAFSHFSKTTASLDNLDYDSDSSIKSLSCHIYNDDSKLGFSLTGRNPVRVDSVKYGQLGWKSGLQTGDKIRKVNGFDVRCCSQSLIAILIKNNSDINLHVQRENNKRTKKIKTRSVPDVNKKFATISSFNIREECVESINDIIYQSCTDSKFSGASIIKTQIDLCESILTKKDKFKSKSIHSLINIMSGLPPTVPTNNVAVRSGKTSFRRPISYDLSEHKKDGKGLFAKLKKGSSNSRLDEESQYRENTPIYSKNNNIGNHSTNNSDVFVTDTDKKKPHEKTHYPSNRIQGRNFDWDEDDYTLDDDETVVTRMEKLFNNHNNVIKNPALVGALLKYLTIQNIDYYSLLFFLIVQHYKIAIQTKESSKEALRYINEIYTTFLHEKSMLRVDPTGFKPIVFDDLKAVKDLSTVFDDSASIIFSHYISQSINKVQSSIAHGLFSLDSNIEMLSFDEKLSYFNNVIKFVVKTLEDKLIKEQNQNPTRESKEQIQFLSDLISGVRSSLATIYFYFSKKEKEENYDSVSIVSSKINSFLGKSSENLQMMTNCVLEKQPMFCSKLHKKTGSGHSFFKKSKPVRGHVFQEKSFDYPVECILCDRLLWGISPQGYMCNHCQGASHKYCKEFVKTPCQRSDLRKYQRNSTNPIAQTEDEAHKNSIVEEGLAKDAVNNNNNIESKDSPDIPDVPETDQKLNQVENECISEDQMQISTSSISSDISQNTKPPSVISKATIVITHNEKPLDNTCDTESLDSVSEIYPFDKPLDSIRSDGERADFHIDIRSHVKHMANKYDQKTIPRSHSENNIESSTLPRTNKRVSDTVFVQDLIQETVIWSHDPDMAVGETFEADKELEAFPDHLSKDEDKAEYTRLLVLMEFHHKTKFTVMTLKRFDYLLIKPWPADDILLLKTLSLNCIVPLYGLIKMLVDTIESCRTKASFNNDTANKVLDWLVRDDETNLQEWLKYSIDLCCTNSLMQVKNTWKDYRKNDPKFHVVLNRRYNKMIMVEQLSNMRPLLFNFPLIVNKLVRDLSKFSKFKDEVKVWKLIHEKFKLLPTFIDTHCMPLVQLINNGTIINSLDRSGWLGKLNQNDQSYDYIIDFPKTAFHYKLFDFQEIKISNFRESGKVKIPAVFVKETCDAYAICYENILVLLQKENDKYVLKQFKATDASKCSPILIVDNVHTSKGERKGLFYELTLVFINVAVLTQVLFRNKEIMERWYDFIYKMKNKNLKKTPNSGIANMQSNESFNYDSLSKEFGNTDIDTDSYTRTYEGTEKANDIKYDYNMEEVSNKYDSIKESLDQYLNCFNFTKPEENSEEIVFPHTNDPYEMLIRTVYDTGNLLKLCNDSLIAETANKSPHTSVKDEILDQLLSCLSIMQNRIVQYKNTRDSISLNDIDYVISEHNEPSFQSIEITPPESVHLNESEEQDDVSLPTAENRADAIESTDKENHDSDFVSLSTAENRPDVIESTDKENHDSEESKCQDEQSLPEDLTSYISAYVHKILADAQHELYQSYQSDCDSSSKDDSNDRDSLCKNQIPEPSE